MAKEVDGKWVFKTSVEMSGVNSDQIWPFVADFCNLHKWFPAVDSCYLVEGTVGEVGVVRRCTTKVFAPADGGTEWTGYANEKLVEFDPTGRSLTYQVLENNFGTPEGKYFGTAKVLESAGGCKLEWSFATEPTEGFNLEEFCSILEASIKTMADRMEAAAKATAA